MKTLSGHITGTALAMAIAGGAMSPAPATAGVPVATPGRVILAPGDDAASALQGASVSATAARLQAAWLHAGHSDAATQTGQAIALKSGTVLSNTLRVGDPFAFPAVQFAYASSTPGLGQADFTFTSATGPRALTISYLPPAYTTKGTVTFAFLAAIPFYLAPGAWTLSGATLYDNTGASVSYSAVQLAGLFGASAFTVVNDGPVDSAPPMLGVGHLLTPTISLSAVHPALKATLPVSDGGTGVGQAILFLTPPGQTYSQGQLATIPLPVKSGTLAIYDDFYPGEPTGTWAFHEVLVCDVAGNCDAITDKQAIFNLFGANSVTVTN